MRITKRLRKGANALAALAAGLMLFGAAACSHDSGGSEDRKEDDKTGTSTSALYRLNAKEGCDFKDGAITNFGSGDSADVSGGVFLYYPVAIDLAKDTAEFSTSVTVSAASGKMGVGLIDVKGGKVDSYAFATTANAVRYNLASEDKGAGWNSDSTLGKGNDGKPKVCSTNVPYTFKVTVSGGRITFDILDESGANVATNGIAYTSRITPNGNVYLAIGSVNGDTNLISYKNIKVKVNGGTEYTINEIEDIPDKSTLSVDKTSAEVNEDESIEIGYTALDKNGDPAEIDVSSSKEEFATVAVADGKIRITGVAAGTATITVINATNTDLKATIAVTVNGFNKTDGYDLVGVYPANGATAAYEDGEFMLTFDDVPELNAGYSIKIYNEDGTEADSIAFADETMTLFGTEFGVEDQLVRVEGNSVYFTPHIGKIANGKTYYVAIPNGAITGTMSGSTFTGLTNSKENTKWKFTTRSKKTAGTTITVDGAQDSTADFRTIQGALNAIGSSSGSYRITVAKGVYRELLYFNGSADVEIEGALGTVGDYGKDVEVRYANAGSLNNSKNNDEKRRCLFEFIGGDLILENIYFNNTFLRDNTKGGALGGKKFTANTQGEALGFDSGTGKRVAAYNCGFYGHQDTIRTIQKAWFYGCYIAGDVDFIWQESDGLVQLVERCEIVVLGDDTNTAYIVAPGAKNSAPVGKGSVILNSTVDVQCAKSYYGRTPWENGRYNNAAIVNTTFTKSGSGELITDFYGESCKDNIDDKYVGWKTYGNTLPTGQTDTTTNHVALDEAFYKQEYSGRKTILNRVYEGGKFVQDASSKWDVDALISDQGWEVDEDTSSDLASGETEKKSTTYDIAALALAASNMMPADSNEGKALTDGSSSDGVLTWKNLKAAKVAYGTVTQATTEITLKVSEPSVISWTGSSYANGTISVKDANGKSLVTAADAKTAPDKSSQSFLYTETGETTLTLTFTGSTYINNIIIKTLTDEKNKVTAVAISGNTLIAPDEETTLTANVKSAYLNDMSGSTVSWSSDNPSVATVTNGGVVKGVATGTATITASCGGESGTILVEVDGSDVVSSDTFFDLRTLFSGLSTSGAASTGIIGKLSYSAMYYKDSQHGAWFYNTSTLSFKVKGACTIYLGKNSNNGADYTVSDGSNSSELDAKGSGVLDTKVTEDMSGDTENPSFKYTGNSEATITISVKGGSGQNYLPAIQVKF